MCSELGSRAVDRVLGKGLRRGGHLTSVSEDSGAQYGRSS